MLVGKTGFFAGLLLEMNNKFELKESPTIKGHGNLVLAVVFGETFLVYLTWIASFYFVIEAFVHMEVHSIYNSVNERLFGSVFHSDIGGPLMLLQLAGLVSFSILEVLVVVTY